MPSKRSEDAKKDLLRRVEDATEEYETPDYSSGDSEGARAEEEEDCLPPDDMSCGEDNGSGELDFAQKMSEWGPGGTEPGEQPRSLASQASGLSQGDRRGTGQSEQRGRATVGGQATLRGPAIPPPTSNWGPGRGTDLRRSQSVASRGSGIRDAPSGSGGRFDSGLQQGRRKRRNESSLGQGRESKAVKLFDAPDRPAAFWKPGGIQAQQKGLGDSVTGINLLGGGPEPSNYIGQFVGGASDAIATKTTGQTMDAAACIAGAYNEATKRSSTKEVLAVFTPIHRTELNESTRDGRPWRRNEAGPRRFHVAPEQQRRMEKARRLQQGTAPSTPWWASEAPAGDTGKEAEVVDLTEVTQGQEVDLTGEDDELTRDICHKNGSHSTGRCAMVTSLVHGDTNTDPFCGLSANSNRSRPGQQLHALQGPQKGRFKIACPRLNTLWGDYGLYAVWKKLVVDRRRMPPLAVYTEEFCFVELTIRFAEIRNGNRLPPEMEGIWPYTKADAVKYQKECDRFWEIGMENMPPGELEGLTMGEIRQAYGAGRIVAQVRYNAADKKKAALNAAKVERGDDNGQNKAPTTDDSGDTIMGGQPPARQVIPVPEPSHSGAAGAAASHVVGRMNRRLQAEKEKEKAAAEEVAERKDTEPSAFDRAKERMRNQRLPEGDLSTQDKGATDERAEVPPLRINKATKPRELSKSSIAVMAKAREGREAKFTTPANGDTVMGATLEAEAVQEQPRTGAEEDILGIIQGPEDIPGKLWAAWTLVGQKEQLAFQPDIVGMYQQILDARKPGTEQITQTRVFVYLSEKRRLGQLPQAMADAWDECIREWTWVESE